MRRSNGKFAYWKPGEERAEWILAATPHVVTMLKRNFPGFEQDYNGWLHVTVSRESAYTLRWFMGRYPLEPHDDEAAAQLDKLATEYEAAQDAVQQVLDGTATWDHGHRQPALQPRDYQLVVPALLKATGGLLVGDDVGLGKTFSGSLIFCEPGALPAVVVAPTHLVPQWQHELALYYPWLRTHAVTKGSPYSLPDEGQDIFDVIAARRGGGGQRPDVLVVNYHKLAGWADWLAGPIATIVFDEAHELRTGPRTATGGSRWYTAGAMIADQARYRVLLTATPIYNYGNEIHNVISMVNPAALGTKDEFTRQWGGKIINAPRALGTHLRDEGLMIRRTREEVGRELPPVLPVEQAVDTDRRRLESMLAEGVTAMARLVLDDAAAMKDRFTAGGQLTMKVRHATGVAKAPFVAEFVRMLLEEQEKVLLVGWHHDTYAAWRERLAEFRPVMYTGQESVPQKEQARAAFVDGDARIMMMSLRSGAGINGLQAVCSTVVFGELDWSPAQHTQVIGRLARDGQTNPVAAFFLVSDSGSDPPMAEVLDVKNRIAKPIVDPNAPVAQPSQQEEMDRARRIAQQVLRKHGHVAATGPARQGDLFEGVPLAVASG